MKKLSDKYGDKVLVIREYVAGELSLKEVRKSTGLSYYLIHKLAEQIGAEREKKKSQVWVQKYEDKIPLLYEALTMNFELRQELDAYVGLDYHIINKIADSIGLELPKFRQGSKSGRYVRGVIVENKKVVDELIEEGETKADIANLLGKTRELVRQYVRDSGQYEKHKAAVKNKREMKMDLAKRAVNTLLTYTLNKADQEGIGGAVRYHFKHYTKIPLEKLIDLVRIYDMAKKRDVKLGIMELGKLSDIRGVQGVLSGMGLESLNWTCGEVISPEKREAIKRVFDSKLSVNDISYFLDVNDGSVVYRFAKDGKERKPREGIKRFYIGRKKPYLTYRDASQIYGFRDEFNSSDNEIAEAIGKPLSLVKYGLEQRAEIEPKLVDALQKMFPNENITKGYK